MFESTARRLIDNHFVEGLRPSAFARLQSHMSACTSCRSYYDRLFGFEAAYDGGKGEVDRIGAQVFAALDLETEPEGLFTRVPARFRAWFTYGMPVAAAAAVLIAVVSTQNRTDDFAARGGPATQAHPQIVGSCFVAENGVPTAAQTLASPGDAIPACPRGGRLKLAYRGATEDDRLVVVAVRPASSSLIYPRVEDTGPLALTGATGPVMLPGSFEIPPDAPAGTVEIIGYFGPANGLKPIEEAVRVGRDLASIPKQENVKIDRVLYRLE